jgi:Ca2+-binding RTX toxin-like protein
MTTTPTVWKAAFNASAGAAGADYRPVAIGLADNRILTVSDRSGGDSAPGFDIFGRIYDAQGNATGGAVRLNQTSYLDDELFAAVAALPNGGFVVAYLDRHSTDDAAIRFERYSAAGTRVAGGTIATGFEWYVNTRPSIAVFANGDFVVTYEQGLASGNGNIFGKVVSGATNGVGATLNVAQNGTQQDILPDTVVLSNGTILTAYQDGDGVEAKIITKAGANVRVAPIAAAGIDPHVAALVGGGFVVVWREEPSSGDGDIHAEIRNNTGGIIKTSFFVHLEGPFNDQSEPDVIALKDGGFFVVWQNALADLQGLRFDATGAAVGEVFAVGSGAASGVSDVQLGLIDDGRILVTYGAAGADIYQTILDPRDKVINGDSAGETITSRIDGATVRGNGGNDTLLGQGAVDNLFGGLGNDVLKGGGSGDTLDGESGADKMTGGVGYDTYVVDNVGDIVDETGGNGIDLVKSSANFNLASAKVLGAVENLTLVGATATTGVGNALSNTITGNGINNALTGGIGNDTLSGNAGADALRGQEGKDRLTGGPGNDRFIFDKAPIAANVDTITDFANVVGSNNDCFQLENLVFSGLGAPGIMNAALFFAGPAAHDANDRIIYNQATGALLYDNNGNAAGGVFQIAVLTTKPMLTAADFVVI